MIKGYILLAIAIALEIVSTSMLKASCGFTKVMPSVAFLVGMGTCFYIFSKSLMLLPLGIAYAIWAGVGTALTALVAVVIWHEQIDITTGVGIVFIIVGVIMLNIRSIIK